MHLNRALSACLDGYAGNDGHIGIYILRCMALLRSGFHAIYASLGNSKYVNQEDDWWNAPYKAESEDKE